MKFLILLAICFAFVHCVPVKQNEIRTWEQYKEFFNKKYSSEEEIIRKRAFERSLEWLDQNKDQQSDAKFGLTEYSDSYDNELIESFSREEILSGLSHIPVYNASSKVNEYANLPTKFDWREHIHFNPIENQGQCGSCWAFAAVFTVEAAYAIKKKVNVRLTKQQVVDCTLQSHDSSYHSQGCNSGFVADAMRYTQEHGIVEEQYYPYQARNGQCKSTQNKLYHINSFSQTPVDSSDENLMNTLVQHGPLVLHINSNAAAFMNYRSGIIRNTLSHTHTVTHAVELIGFGTENGIDYWLIRNQWSQNWGEDGNARVERHHSNLGINFLTMFPNLN